VSKDFLICLFSWIT